ncbi:conserved hypothetical protein [Aspergillus terreus NIH2624]|uniref:Cytochrome P450 n=1 Tax=Aspergillus terreus (strain NIH 2624 / FGSC A1156) TaxID=341663 RepID=Q0CZC9_ASPTN|nr:uncharacterized protein ATEG_00955 [Aspergillus terreus NIH2624]EAU39601.1 conserved hypothetical protein [Aspergillus terreus NIH2624]
MGRLVEQGIVHPYYSFILLIIFLLCVSYIIGVVKAIVSPLSRIPGPWYAPLTTLHLNYAFATGKIWKIVEKGHQEYGSIMRLGPRQVWVSDMEAMRTILITADLPKVTIDAFSSRRFETFTQPATMDLMDDLHSLALDIMGECSFGRGFGYTNPQKETTFGIDEKIWSGIPSAIFKGMAQRYQMVYFKRLLRKIGVDIKFDWPDSMIAKNLGPDLLQHLIDEGEKPDSGMKMVPRDVIDQMSEVLLAGSETTSGTIGCFFLEVLRNPQVKARLLEALPVLLPNDSIITSKAVRTDSQYEYLEACIKETLRLHPIASEMGRRTLNQSIELIGFSIPPHTFVCASYRDLHRNPAYWPDPLRFWPERWLQNRPPDVPPPKYVPAVRDSLTAYYPFSAGKHSCIGKNFAWAEIRMVTANLLSRFEFIEVPAQDIDYRQYITMQFANGSWKAFLKPRYESRAEFFTI